jgi:hypothetical protein
MSCSCPTSDKQLYFANIQLFPELKDGLVNGGSHHLSTKEVCVCTQCSRAEFSIEKSELRGLRKWQSYRAPVS